MNQLLKTIDTKEGVSRPKNWLKRNKTQFEILGMSLPGAILLLLFCYLPMFGIVLAFKDYSPRDGILGSAWAGLSNFSYLFKSNDIFIVLRNTIGYNLVFILLGSVLNISLALAVTSVRQKMASRFYQTVYIMPYFLSWVIISYLGLALMNVRNGFFNQSLLPAMGLDPIDWYTNPKPWPFILAFANFWKWTGYSSIVYIAAIAGIDPTYYEAATIDGASGWQKVWHITLPCLRTIFCINLITQVGGILSGDMGLFYQLPLDSGALADVTTTIPVYVFKNLTKGSASSLGISSATAFIQSVVGCILVITVNKVVDKISSGESALF